MQKYQFCKLCVAPNLLTKTAMSFPSIHCGLHIFHWRVVWKLVDDILITWSDRLLLCFEFISNWVVNNFNVGFCCVMFMSMVSVLGLFSDWVTMKYHTSVWNVKCVFCCKFPLLQYRQIFLRSVNNIQSNRKNKKGARFFETQCSSGKFCGKINFFYSFFIRQINGITLLTPLPNFDNHVMIQNGRRISLCQIINKSY